MKKNLPLALIFFSLFINLSTMTSDPSIADHVATQYVHAMFGPKIHEKPVKQEPGTFKLSNPETRALQDCQAQEIAFNLAIEYLKTDTPTIIDKTFIDKMELVLGGENPQAHLFGRVLGQHINTAMGTAHATLSLCSPTNNIDLVRHRQEVVQALINNEDDLDTCDQLLTQIKNAEKDLLLFWDDQPPVNPQLLYFLYFNKWLNPLNANTPALEFSNKLFSMFQISFGLFGMPGLMIWNISRAAHCSIGRATQLLINGCKTVLLNPDANWASKAGLVAGLVAIPGYQGLIAYLMARDLKNKTEICNHLQKILIGTASYVDNLKQLGAIITKHKELGKHIPAFNHLVNLTNSDSHDSKFNKLLSMLDTNTFNGEPSFFSITGRVLAAHTLMKEVKEELIPVLLAAGELDTYVALAKAYKAHETKNAGYCFVEFIDADAPTVEAHNFWNPFIPLTEVVPNTISLGPLNPNIILTGPNTGGKSTIIKGLIVNLLLAQTFGIASAEKLIITPFEKLNCYLNITDDIATGVSLFKAEVLRAKQLINMISGLEHDKFSFTVMDEVFSGTAPQEGEIAAHLFAKQLSTFDNNMSIIATHYPKMIELEADTNGAYKNYQVEVTREDDGRITRTFKLLPGPATINIAIDILKEEGVL